MKKNLYAMILCSNLLLNPQFRFVELSGIRCAQRSSGSSKSVAFWNTDAWGDIEVMRVSRNIGFRPQFAVENVVRLKPGKKIRQFATLPELSCGIGDHVCLSVHGFQKQPASLVMRLCIMCIESADGTWSPADFGLADKRTFSRHGRGELLRRPVFEKTTGKNKNFSISIEDAEIPGKFKLSRESSKEFTNTVGILVEFENTSKTGDVWLYYPSLNRISNTTVFPPSSRPLPELYRHIPRTIQKLLKGKPIHILTLGSSIDRGSANPPLYLYNEKPESSDFKKPLMDRHKFDGEKVNQPELNDYVARWQHYFMYTGRLRRALMKKFDYPVNKILLNVMACDGSSVGESHSGFREYSELKCPPKGEINGHPSGKTWKQLYPELFSRPEGTVPDLVIFGHGANEHIDAPDQVAVYEGAIRWFQRHYPQVEFIFCMFGGNNPSPNLDQVKELALVYQIPCIDFVRILKLLEMSANFYSFCPDGGHPQAAVHYLWFKQLEQAFQIANPVKPGIAQRYLPERVNQFTYGWEGDMVTFTALHPRIIGTRMIIEDTVFNLWAEEKDKNKVMSLRVDGTKIEDAGRGKTINPRNIRNSTLEYGRLRLGDRHLIEVIGETPSIVAVDCKVCPQRRFIPISSPCWLKQVKKIVPFKSNWGFPYGKDSLILEKGESCEIDVVGTDFSIAYVDHSGYGTLCVLLDNKEILVQPTDIPFVDSEGKEHFLENRKGILHLPFGLHRVKVQARGARIQILGMFVYDSRPNRAAERCVSGTAAPGETVTFSPSFRARPVVYCAGELKCRTSDIKPSEVTFCGTGSGTFTAVGE